MHDAQTGTLETEWQLDSDQLPRFFYVFFSPNNRVVGFRGERRIQLYDLQTLERLGSVDVWLPFIDRLYGPTYPFEEVTGFSPNSQWLIGLNSLQLLLWNVETGEAVLDLRVDPAYGYSFNASGDLLTFGTDEGVVLVDLETLEGYLLFKNLRVKPPLAFSPDGSALIVGSDTISSQANFSSFLLAGIPSSLRPSWEGFEGHILPESINLRAGPSPDEEVVGTVSGDVRVVAQSENGDYYLLADEDAWVRSDPIYLEMNQFQRDSLPVRVEAKEAT